jgi:hypothetical protein
LSFCLLSKNVKIKIYKTIILPFVLYGWETWSLTLKQEQKHIYFKKFSAFHLCMKVIDLDSQPVSNVTVVQILFHSEHMSLEHSLWQTCGFRVGRRRSKVSPSEGERTAIPSCQVKYVTAMTKQKVAASDYCYGEYPSGQALQILLLLALVHYHWLVASCTFLLHVCLH